MFKNNSRQKNRNVYPDQIEKWRLTLHLNVKDLMTKASYRNTVR